MKELKFDYDTKYDDLFVYSEKKSDGSIEIGDFVFDFTNEGELVAFEIQNAIKNLNSISEKPFKDLNQLKSCKIEINTIKNFLVLKIELTTEKDIIYSNIIIPNIREESPALRY
jgi:uncharacterized protein YuzE